MPDYFILCGMVGCEESDIVFYTFFSYLCNGIKFKMFASIFGMMLALSVNLTILMIATT